MQENFRTWATNLRNNLLKEFWISLQNLVAPKIAPFNFGDEPSNFGDSASVQCLVTSGDFPIDFKWLYNGRPVSEVFGISTVKLGKRTYALTIDSVNGKHAGNYTCEASNSAGVDRYNATLVVNGTTNNKDSVLNNPKHKTFIVI